MENRSNEAGESNLLTAAASDGTSFRAEVDGSGRTILQPVEKVAVGVNPIAERCRLLAVLARPVLETCP